MKKLYLLGGGGHCRSAIDVIELEAKYAIAGIFDLKENIGKTVFNYLIIDEDKNLQKYINSENYFLITIGQIKNPTPRIKAFEVLQKLGANFATIISPLAHVSKHSIIADGSIVMHHSIINAGSRIGKNCIINTKALIEHDVIVNDHCHCSTASIVNGGCIIEANSFIGSNTVLKEGVRVPISSVIGAGRFYNGK